MQSGKYNQEHDEETNRDLFWAPAQHIIGVSVTLKVKFLTGLKLPKVYSANPQVLSD